MSPVLSHRLREYAVGPKLRALRLRKKIGLVELGRPRSLLHGRRPQVLRHRPARGADPLQRKTRRPRGRKGVRVSGLHRNRAEVERLLGEVRFRRQATITRTRRGQFNVLRRVAAAPV